MLWSDRVQAGQLDASRSTVLEGLECVEIEDHKS